jgi:hypothetical protein
MELLVVGGEFQRCEKVGVGRRVRHGDVRVGGGELEEIRSLCRL